MKNSLKEKYGFETRIATYKEIEDLAEFLANQNLKNKLKSKSLSSIEENRTRIIELIDNTVIVQDYKKFDVSIYLYNYSQQYNQNEVMSIPFRVLKTKFGMETLTQNDIVFKLKDLQKEKYRKKVKTKGRQKRPMDESIEKTIQVKKYLEKHTLKNIAGICNEFGFSKTTFYRVSKWIDSHKLKI
ncbi:hypothetical protein [Aquimarina longa]|uniref:hypothetical protein n=1 Tax=Aquimarina longa TaxID=1080221 RepID=UPI000781CB22|nr:hypothetical protein [Aquimarina longa]